MTDPKPAERHWLAMAIAILWLVSVGGEADATKTASGYAVLPANHVARNLPPANQPARLLSCFRRGFIKIIVALLLGQPLPCGHFLPQLWTTHLNFSSA